MVEMGVIDFPNNVSVLADRTTAARQSASPYTPISSSANPSNR
jgi:hypothetical protein